MKSNVLPGSPSNSPLEMDVPRSWGRKVPGGNEEQFSGVGVEVVHLEGLVKEGKET